MPSLLAPEHVSALTDSQTWSDNPFAARESRRDRKRRQLTKTLAWLAVIVLIFGVPAVLGLAALERRYHSVPWYLGGDPYMALMILVCGIHVWFVASTAQRGTVLMLAQEASRNTLMHLLTLPTSRFQIILSTAIYPWRSAMLVALALLPFYAFEASIERISWLDLLLLYVVFALSAISFPLLKRPGVGDTSPSTPQPLSKQQSSVATVSMGGPNARQQQQTGANANGAWITLAFLLPMLCIVFSFASGRGVSGMYANLHPYLPDSLIELMPSSMLSWPLLMARGLVTPIDWFGIGVPPAVLILPLIIVNRYVQIVRTAEYLQVGTYRDLALLPTYLPRRRLEGVLRSIQLIVATGYAWRWLIWNGGLRFFPGTPNLQAPGLASFAYAVLFVVVWAVLVRSSLIATWMRAELKPADRPAARALTARRCLRFLAEPVIYGIGFYGVCCLLSRTQPLPDAVRTLAFEMLSICATASLLCFGADVVLAPIAGISRLVLPVIAFVGYNSYHLPLLRKLAYLSPTLGVVSLLHPVAAGVGPFFAGLDWHQWLIPGFSIGGMLSIIGLTRYASRTQDSAANALRLDPTRYGMEVFHDEAIAAMDPTRKEDTPFVTTTIRYLQRIADNAITTREIRTRMRGKLDSNALRNTAMMFVIVTVGIYEGAPEIAGGIGHWASMALYGPLQSPNIQVIADILGCWFIAMALFCSLAGFAALRTFAVEKEKSTLGFILLTPMSNSSIVRGKATGILLSSATIAIAIAIWTLLMSFIISPAVGANAITSWALVVTGCGMAFMAAGMLSLACGAVMTRLSLNPGCWTFFVVIATQVVINGGRFAFRYVVELLDDYGITGIRIYFLLLGICAVVITSSYAVTVFFISRMRHGDLAFAATKRDN